MNADDSGAISYPPHDGASFMISAQSSDIGRAVVYRYMNTAEPELGEITKVTDYFVFVRFTPNGIGIACHPRDLEWSILECPTTKPEPALPSAATKPAAPSNGNLPHLALVPPLETSSNPGPTPKPKDGGQESSEPKTMTGTTSGSIAALNAAFKPFLRPNERAEVEAFMLGFALCWQSYDMALDTVGMPTDVHEEVYKVAKKLYPDFDPPTPFKRRRPEQAA